MFNVPDFDKLAKYVLEFYRGRPVILQPFDYPMPNIPILAAGASATSSIKVSSNADFWIYEANGAMDGDPSFLFAQVTDTGSQETLITGQNLQNFVRGSEIVRFNQTPDGLILSGTLPLPKRVAANSVITYTWTNTDTLPTIAPFYVTLTGVLAFPQG